MPILSGQKLEASTLNHLQPQVYESVATVALTRTDTTTYADITDATVTFSTETANAIAVVDAEFDCAVGNADTGTDMNGRIMVDGVAGTRLAKHSLDDAGLDRDTVYMFEKFTLASAGSHTIKLQGALSTTGPGASGTFQVFTSIKVTVYEAV